MASGFDVDIGFVATYLRRYSAHLTVGRFFFVFNLPLSCIGPPTGASLDGRVQTHGAGHLVAVAGCGASRTSADTVHRSAHGRFDEGGCLTLPR